MQSDMFYIFFKLSMTFSKKKKIVPWNDPSKRVRTIQRIGWKRVWKSTASSVGAVVALRISL